MTAYSKETEREIERLLEGCLECKIHPLGPGGAIVRYFVYEEDAYPCTEGYELPESYSQLWPVEPNLYHYMDVDKLMELVSRFATDETFRKKAVEAIAKHDSEEMLLQRLMQVDRTMYQRLKNRWGEERAADEISELDLFQTMAKLGSNSSFWPYFRKHAYLECSNYVLGSESEYYVEGSEEIEDLPDCFFDDLFRLVREEYLAFDEIPVDEDPQGQLIVQHPSELVATENYRHLTLKEDWHNPSLTLVFEVADVDDGFTDGKVVLEWRHDVNRAQYGKQTEFPNWGEAMDFCRQVKVDCIEKITSLDHHRAIGMMRFKVAEWLLEDYNCTIRGEVYALREAYVAMDEDGVWEVIEDEFQTGNIFGNYDMADLDIENSESERIENKEKLDNAA